MLKLFAYAFFVCVVLLVGCPQTSMQTTFFQEEETPQGDGPITTIGGFNHRRLHSDLQGEWVVMRRSRRIYEFNIQGEKATAVDYRYAIPKTVEGELVLRSATGFGVKGADSVTYYYSFVQTAGKTYMGLGGAIHIEGNEDFRAKLGAWEDLVKSGEICTYVKKWAGKAIRKEVECGFVERADEVVFSYQAEDPFKPNILKTFQLYRTGDYLLEHELYYSEAKPRALVGRTFKSKAAKKPNLAHQVDAEKDELKPKPVPPLVDSVRIAPVKSKQ